jgi:hypothetical protein
MGQYQSVFCLCVRVTQGNSLKVVENRIAWGWGKERTVERVNLISVQYMHIRNTTVNPFVYLTYTNKNLKSKRRLINVSQNHSKKL